jgi:hypothetical protein
MNIQKFLATIFGDIWYSKKCFGLGNYIYGNPDSKLHGTDYREFSKIIKPGDILLTRSENYKFSNKGIPEKHTFLKHLAVYVGGVDGREKGDIIDKPTRDGKQFPKCVIHAISEGVVCQDLFDIFCHFDYIVVVRPWKTEFSQSTICDVAFSLLGKEYDFEFKSGNNKYYCTELGISCIKAAVKMVPKMTKINTHILGLFLPLKRFKRNVTVADSFLECFPIVYESRSYKDRLRNG